MEDKLEFKQLIVLIPSFEHQEIKMRALRKGISLKIWVLEALQEKIKEENKYE